MFTRVMPTSRVRRDSSALAGQALPEFKRPLEGCQRVVAAQAMVDEPAVEVVAGRVVDVIEVARVGTYHLLQEGYVLFGPCERLGQAACRSRARRERRPFV
jgi:hypothetical protein